MPSERVRARHFRADGRRLTDGTPTVYPGRRIRLCQFHVVQAITRFDCDNGDRGAPMRIGVEIKAKIIYHFRILQRCRSELEWEGALNTFLSQVERAIMTQRVAPKNTDAPAVTTQDDLNRYRAQYEFVRTYFQVNWFTAEWIGEWTYAILHAHQPRTRSLQRRSRIWDCLRTGLETGPGTQTTS